MVNPGAFSGSRKEFLLSEKSYYAKAVDDGYATEAISRIQRRYFKRFSIDIPHDEEPSDEFLNSVDDEAIDPDPPEIDKDALTPEEYELQNSKHIARQELIDFRKAQIKRWMSYQYMKDHDHDAKDPTSSNPYTPLFYKLSGKEPNKPRLKTSTNVWRKTQRELIENKVKLKAAELGVDKKGLAALRDKVTRSMFNAMSDEEKNHWHEVAKREHQEALEVYKKEMETGPSTDPVDRQRCIQGLVKFAQPMLDMICLLTGWKATLLAGGPEPAHGGRLNVISVHSGHIAGDVKMNFGNLERARYKSQLLPMYGNFLQKCYTPEECRARAIQPGKGYMPLSMHDLAEHHANYDSVDNIDSPVPTASTTALVAAEFTQTAQDLAPRKTAEDNRRCDTLSPTSDEEDEAMRLFDNLDDLDQAALPKDPGVPGAAFDTMEDEGPNVNSKIGEDETGADSAPGLSPPPSPLHATSPLRSPRESASPHLPTLRVDTSALDVNLLSNHPHAPGEKRKIAENEETSSEDQPRKRIRGSCTPPTTMGSNQAVSTPSASSSKMLSLSSSLSEPPTESFPTLPGAISPPLPIIRPDEPSHRPAPLWRRSAEAAESMPPEQSDSMDTLSVAADAFVPEESAPDWFQKGVGMLLSEDMGTPWKTLVEAWAKLEMENSYVETPGKKLGTSHRPDAVGEWMKRHRSPAYRPHINNPKVYMKDFNSWWTTLQPSWRVSSRGTILRNNLDGDWSVLKRSGKNGVFSVLVGLFFIGIVVSNGDKKGALYKAWLESVKDCHQVFECLV